MPGEHDREAMRLAGLPSSVPWTPRVGVGGWLLSIVAVLVTAPIVAGALITSGLDNEAVSVALIPLSPVVTGLVALGLAAGLAGSSARTLLGRGRPRPRSLLAGAGLGVAAFVLFNVVLGVLLSSLLQSLGMDSPEVQPGLRDAAGRPEALPILVLSTTVAAPLGEELLYRGLLFQSLLSRFRPATAMWLSAVAFGLGHATIGVGLLSNVVLAVLIVPLGVVLAWAFRRWATLWVPVAIHAVFNGITVVLMAVGMV